MGPLNYFSACIISNLFSRRINHSKQLVFKYILHQTYEELGEIPVQRFADRRESDKTCSLGRRESETLTGDHISGLKLVKLVLRFKVRQGQKWNVYNYIIFLKLQAVGSWDWKTTPLLKTADINQNESAKGRVVQYVFNVFYSELLKTYNIYAYFIIDKRIERQSILKTPPFFKFMVKIQTKLKIA